MVTASTGVQTDWSKVVHSSCRPICHSSEQQSFIICIPSARPTCLGHRCSVSLYVSPVPDQHAWDIDVLNINWSGLTASAYLPTALLHRVIQKIRQSNCIIMLIAPGWPGMPWFWDLVQLSTLIPLQLPVSTTLLKQSHNQVFHSNP